MAKRPVPKYDFKAFGAAIKAARTGRKESRKKVSLHAMNVRCRLLDAKIEIMKQEASTKEEDLKIKLGVAEHKLKKLTEKIKKSTIQMETDRRMIEYQEITELTPQLMNE